MSNAPGLRAAAVRLGIAAVVVGASIAAHSDRAAAASGGEPVLGGITVITGSSPGWMTVRIPVAAAISGAIGTAGGFPFARNHDIVVQGRGRLAGLVLHRPGTTVFAAQIGYCGAPGCIPYFMAGAAYDPTLVSDEVHMVELDPAPPQRSNPDTATGHMTLPAGDYQLYLITDGTPVTVTLRLHRSDDYSYLDGTSSSLTPSQPSTVRWPSPRADVDPPSPAVLAYSAGTPYDVGPAGGVVFTDLFAVEAQPTFPLGDLADRVEGSCLYAAAPPVYLPGATSGTNLDTGAQGCPTAITTSYPAAGLVLSASNPAGAGYYGHEISPSGSDTTYPFFGCYVIDPSLSDPTHADVTGSSACYATSGPTAGAVSAYYLATYLDQSAPVPDFFTLAFAASGGHTAAPSHDAGGPAHTSAGAAGVATSPPLDRVSAALRRVMRQLGGAWL